MSKKKPKVEFSSEALLRKVWSLHNEPFPWQLHQSKAVVDRALSGRHPQAWLVMGPEGVGKRFFVHWWLKWLHCRSANSGLMNTDQTQSDLMKKAPGAELSHDGINAARLNNPLDTLEDLKQEVKQEIKACGRCQDCHQVEASTHADVLWVKPEEGSRSIKIDQVRQISSFSQHTAKRSLFRTVVIEPAHAMPIAAQNALLKTLEEPGVRTVFFLISDHTQALLPTIISRTQRLAFGTPMKDDVQDWLSGLPEKIFPTGITPLQAIEHLDAVQGSPLKLICHLHDPWAQARLDLIKQLRAPFALTTLASQWSQWSLFERLKVLIQLMQQDLKAAGSAAAGNVALVESLESAFEYYDQVVSIYSDASRSLSLNEGLSWERALIVWGTFTRMLNFGSSQV